MPYSEDQIKHAAEDATHQADWEANYEDDLIERYGENVNIRDFDGQPEIVTEMDALVAYLQVLGTMVDFDSVNVEEIAR